MGRAEIDVLARKFIDKRGIGSDLSPFPRALGFFAMSLEEKLDKIRSPKLQNQKEVGLNHCFVYLTDN